MLSIFNRCFLELWEGKVEILGIDVIGTTVTYWPFLLYLAAFEGLAHTLCTTESPRAKCEYCPVVKGRNT